ncbi:MAG TPA: tetratricopeptide repeat protein [Terriglobales bacterium]|nr:tetratricopeptide repeat protein [Terriglobales bacterium]
MRFLKVCFALGCLALWPRQSFAGEPQWVEVKSPNFSVITDAGEKRGRDVALHFEQMRSVFGTLMTKAHVNLSVPLQIVAFRSSKEIRQVAPIFNGKPTELAGLFQGGEDRSFIMLDMSVDKPWAVVFHEYAHRLMDGNLSFRTDPWFEEGFAEYFASIEVDNKEARVGKIPEDTYRILQQDGMMRVADLFRVQQYSKTYNESGDHRSVFYAEASLVVHYLYDNQLMLKLADYFDALRNQKKTVEQAMQQAFGMTPEQFDNILRNYLSSGRFKYYPVSTPSGIVAAQFSATPVSLADAHAVLADIDAHSHDHQDRALRECQEVLEADPNNASALRGAGYVYLQRQDFEHAGEFFGRAAERDRKDPRVHYYNALMMNRAGGLTDGAKSDEIKKELEIAIALDPQLADAYSLLGYAQAVSGEPEKGLTTMRKAVELSPRNEMYQLNLANIYLANRKADEAIALLRALSGSANAQVASRAREGLEQAEKFKEMSNALGMQVEIRAATARDKTGNPEKTSESDLRVQAPPSGPVRFIKGKLAAVDCSAAPQAVLNVVSGGRSLKMHVGDRKHLVLIGADEFSCDWKNKSVALNYRQRQDGEGDVVSLEVQ